MFLRIEQIGVKKIVGKKLTMSLAADETFLLWQSFMKERRLITNNVSADQLCLQVYHGGLDVAAFDAHTFYDKWAAVEVYNFNGVPPTMETLVIPGGLYAVFLHKGAASEGAKTYQYIYENWLPQSVYQVDNRPQVEVLGEKYKNDDPLSEEEIWIPIQLK
jgi:AraC family transcriptional regulator